MVVDLRDMIFFLGRSSIQIHYKPNVHSILLLNCGNESQFGETYSHPVSTKMTWLDKQPQAYRHVPEPIGNILSQLNAGLGFLDRSKEQYIEYLFSPSGLCYRNQDLRLHAL